MTKKTTKERLQQKLNEKKSKEQPFVSICTPTFNRRPFIKSMFKCYLHQDYPKELMEWIIIDDGTDKIEDLILEADIPQIKYFKYDKKMPLGKKRNLMHEKSKGDIIVYMDDDDYYPPERVSHAVHMLQTNPQAMCAGSSEIYIWFKHINQMKQFGPYGPNHSTAGTFAFRKELLNDHAYENHAALAEEKAFLKNYTVPFVQLDPMKVILVFSHTHNTFDKKKLLDSPNPKFVRDTTKTVDDFVKEGDLKEFYMNEIEGLLENYEPGKPAMKPDVLEQIIKIEETRRKHAESMVQSPILIQKPGEEPQAMNNKQVIEIMNQLRERGGQLEKIVKQRDDEIKMLKDILDIRDKEITMIRANNNNNSNNSNNSNNDELLFKLEKLNLLDKIYYEIVETKKLSMEKSNNNNSAVIAQGPNGEQRPLSNEEIIQLLQQKDAEINNLKNNNNLFNNVNNTNTNANANANNDNMSPEEKAFLDSINGVVSENNISLEISK